MRFGSEAYMAHGMGIKSCFSSQVGSATPDNIRAIQEFIKNSHVKNESSDGYVKALEAAFDLLKKVYSNTNYPRRE